MNTASYGEAIWRDTTRALARVADRGFRESAAVGGGSALVGATAVTLWLAFGVRLGEIVRFVPYELGFVFLPGWLVYRSLVSSPGGRLRQLVLGWSLGYLLEILAFTATSAIGLRDLFLVYPAVVGVPAAFLAWKRKRVKPRTDDASLPEYGGVSIAPIWVGALLCTLLLIYAAAVGFTQTPLPRDVVSATYQEDTVFAISLAAEALHHAPVTLPMVAGESLHYHLFAFMHMAAISQVTGIDLSVVVMRLYEVPLLLLFALQLIWAGRRVGGGTFAGLAAAFVVLFLGELDAAWTGTSFHFFDLFFYWLLSSHTFLLGLIFFVPATVILCDLITSRAAPRESRWRLWALLGAFLVGCIGAKTYALFALAGGLVVYLLWQLWRERTVNRPALFALGLCGALEVAANVLVFKWSSGGLHADPLRIVTYMRGVEELDIYFARLWDIRHVPTVFGVAYGTFGLLGIPLLGTALLLRYRKLALSAAEAWFLSLFIAGLLPLYVFRQSGLSQLFLVFFCAVPGAILAASGFTLFWRRQTRQTLKAAAVTLAAGVASVIAIDLLLDLTPTIGLRVTLFWLIILAGAAAAVGSSRRFVVSAVSGAGLLGVVLLSTPLIWLVRSGWSAITGRPLQDPTPHFPVWNVVAASVVALVVLVLVARYLTRRPLPAHGLATTVVAGCLLFGLLNTPLDWFPHLTQRATAGEPLYDQENRGLTAGLYRGLLWIRDNTDTDAVLVVNNHSLHPDKRDSKYFYYSAFAQRRVVLEAWDYTAQAAATGLFSLDTAHVPFVRRLTLSDLAFGASDENAIRALARDYGADYLVVDKIHGIASPVLAQNVETVFSSGDIDIYAIGKPALLLSPPGTAPPTSVPPTETCFSTQGAGIAAVFGHRRTLGEALRLRRASRAVGFLGLAIQRRGCHDYAVVLTRLQSLAQAKDFQRQAATVAFDVRLECRTEAPRGGLNAVFGHRRTKRAAERLAARANAAGFEGLDVQQDACGDWEVDLRGLETSAQRREFRREAASVGFRIGFEPG